MSFLVDTDVCIDFLKGRDYAVNLFSEILNNNEVFVSIFTYYELLKGAYKEKEIKVINEFTKVFKILSINKAIIKTAAEFYRKYRKKGITLSNIDCLIMATAKENELKIITRNIKHFPEINLLSNFSKKLLNK